MSNEADAMDVQRGADAITGPRSGAPRVDHAPDDGARKAPEGKSPA